MSKKIISQLLINCIGENGKQEEIQRIPGLVNEEFDWSDDELDLAPSGINQDTRWTTKATRQEIGGRSDSSSPVPGPSNRSSPIPANEFVQPCKRRRSENPRASSSNGNTVNVSSIHFGIPEEEVQTIFELFLSKETKFECIGVEIVDKLSRDIILENGIVKIHADSYNEIFGYPKPIGRDPTKKGFLTHRRRRKIEIGVDRTISEISKIEDNKIIGQFSGNRVHLRDIMTLLGSLQLN